MFGMPLDSNKRLKDGDVVTVACASVDVVDCKMAADNGAMLMPSTWAMSV